MAQYKNSIGKNKYHTQQQNTVQYKNSRQQRWKVQQTTKLETLVIISLAQHNICTTLVVWREKQRGYSANTGDIVHYPPSAAQQKTAQHDTTAQHKTVQHNTAQHKNRDKNQYHTQQHNMAQYKNSRQQSWKVQPQQVQHSTTSALHCSTASANHMYQHQWYHEWSKGDTLYITPKHHSKTQNSAT